MDTGRFLAIKARVCSTRLFSSLSMVIPDRSSLALTAIRMADGNAVDDLSAEEECFSIHPSLNNPSLLISMEENHPPLPDESAFPCSYLESVNCGCRAS